MKVSELRQMAERYWKEAYHEDMSNLGAARFITGLAKNDLFFHHMLIDHGVEMVLEEQTNNRTKWWELVDYRVVDEKKYLLFVLGWT